MNVLATTNLVTLHGSLVTMDDFETGRCFVDEGFGISRVLGGALGASLPLLVFVLYTCLLVTELQKVTR